jgi:uncharacterized protein YbjQ (UPF0145 family)
MVQEDVGLFTGQARLEALAFLRGGRRQVEAGPRGIWRGHEAQSKFAAFNSEARPRPMLTSTTPNIAEREIARTLGVVTGEAIIGANIFRDLLAGITDIIGGRAGTYERGLREARDIAIQEMCAEAASLGGDAVVGIDLDYETMGDRGGMLMVSATGTAVKLR